MRAPGLNEDNPRRIIQAVRELAEGGTNAIGTLTLTAAATSTVVLDDNVSESTMPVLVPWSANAAGVDWWISAVQKGQFTVSHAAAPATATFRYERRRP